MSLKEALLQFGREPVKVDLPELPQVEVYVRSLTAGERLVLEQVRTDGSIVGDHEFVYLGACDAMGKRLFTAEEAKELDGRLAGRICRGVLVASGLAPTSAEEASKNSAGNPS